MAIVSAAAVTPEAGEATPNQEPNVYSRAAWILTAIGGAGIVGCVGVFIVVFHRNPVGEPMHWAAFGDYLAGTAGTLISFATLLAVAHTLRLQASELRTTQKHLADQTKELARQSVHMQRQLSEATYFNLLKRLQAMADDSRPDFGGLVEEVEKLYASHRGGGLTPEQSLAEAYRYVYSEFESSLGPYYRTLFHLLKFVERWDGISNDEQYRYASLLRAQLGADALVMLFFNVLVHPEGTSPVGLRPLVERYGMLKHAPKKELQQSAYFDFRSRPTVVNKIAFLSKSDRDAAALAGSPPN